MNASGNVRLTINAGNVDEAGRLAEGRLTVDVADHVLVSSSPGRRTLLGHVVRSARERSRRVGRVDADLHVDARRQRQLEAVVLLGEHQQAVLEHSALFLVAFQLQQPQLERDVVSFEEKKKKKKGTDVS